MIQEGYLRSTNYLDNCQSAYVLMVFLQLDLFIVADGLSFKPINFLLITVHPSISRQTKKHLKCNGKTVGF